MNIEHIPEELRSSGYLVLWKEISTKDGKHRKTPIASCGRAVGYNDPEALISFSDAKNRLEKGMDIGIGITLLDGLVMQRGESKGYLNCLDFDGFADPSGVRVDPGVMRFLREFPSYTEISPSQTGFKYFFLTDRPPSTKSKIKFGPSTFLQQHPGIRKFANREVEHFSKNLFLALTGELFNLKLDEIKFYSSSEVDTLIDSLNDWAISTGGTGVALGQNKVPPRQRPHIPILRDEGKNYARLKRASLGVVLAHIDHFDEQVWLNVALSLFRAYGEEGFNYFLSFSQGVYCGINFAAFDEAECRDKFDHAIGLTEKRPGYGVRYLIELARSHSDWSNPRLEFEEDRPAKKATDGEKKFEFLTATELSKKPPLEWRVKGLLPIEGLACIYGPSGSGKSFFALDLIASVALNQDFYGARTKPCPIVYVALEGGGGVANRLRAYELHHNVTLPESFRVVTNTLSLFSLESEVFAAAIEEEGLEKGIIVIDTLAQSAPGSDENSSADMGRIISNAQLIQRKTRGLVVLIHHTGKDVRRGARGHSSLEAALDAGIEVSNGKGGRQWRKAKVKDGEAGGSHFFRLESVNLGHDSDGDDISSCVAVGDYFRSVQLQTPQGKNQRLVLEALEKRYPEEETITEMEMLNIAKEAVGGSKNALARAREALEGLQKIDQLVPARGGYKLARKLGF